MPVEFEDNRFRIKEALNDAITAFLYEAGGELQAKTSRNSRKDNGETRGHYDYYVDESANECVVGNPLENAIWEEFGTGEYALHGDGRKGGWYVPEEKLSAKAKTRMKKYVTKDGKVYYFTRGKKPNRPMQRAYDSLKSKLIKRFGEIVKNKMGS